MPGRRTVKMDRPKLTVEHRIVHTAGSDPLVGICGERLDRGAHVSATMWSGSDKGITLCLTCEQIKGWSGAG